MEEQSKENHRTSEAETIPLLTPYKMGTFDLSHRYVVFIFLPSFSRLWFEEERKNV